MELKVNQTYTTQEMIEFFGVSKATWKKKKDRLLDHFRRYYMYEVFYDTKDRRKINYKILKKLLLNKVVEALLPATVEDWRSRQGSADYRNASPIMRQCLVRAVNEDLEGLLPSIKQDTLLVWGDQDTATPIRDANIMKEKITNSGLVVLEGAGHFSFLEKQSLFTNVMRTYFRIGVNEQ